MQQKARCFFFWWVERMSCSTCEFTFILSPSKAKEHKFFAAPNPPGNTIASISSSKIFFFFFLFFFILFFYFFYFLFFTNTLEILIFFLHIFLKLSKKFFTWYSKVIQFVLLQFLHCLIEQHMFKFLFNNDLLILPFNKNVSVFFHNWTIQVIYNLFFFWFFDFLI